MDMRKLAAGEAQPHRIGACRQKERIVCVAGAIIEREMTARPIDRCGTRVEMHLDIMFPVEFRRAQWDPVLRSGAREIILGQIRPVIRHR